jgi:hypothetical protein
MTEHDIERIAPFTNCQFKYCDLIGQCKSEGKCHHPRAEKPQGEAVAIVEVWNEGGSGEFKTATGIEKLPIGTELFTYQPDQSEEITKLKNILRLRRLLFNAREARLRKALKNCAESLKGYRRDE